MKAETRNLETEGIPKAENRSGFARAVALAAACLLLAGCQSTRSISNSGRLGPDSACAFAPRPNESDPGFEYRGELSEFDVLGITRNGVADEAQIQQAIAGARRVQLRAGGSILLVQSGAMFPDGPMVEELSKHFRVVAFSGVPPVSHPSQNGTYESGNAASYSRSLRLAAARGGCDVILCYWDVLESENSRLATKTVSWVPVMNWLVPDEREHMRIRLKLALIDVRTGDWAVLSPEPIDSAKLSWRPRRGVADRGLVESLKQRAYAAGAKELLLQYSRIQAAN
jgi:hypothetical protein